MYPTGLLEVPAWGLMDACQTPRDDVGDNDDDDDDDDDGNDGDDDDNSDDGYDALLITFPSPAHNAS